VTSGSYRHRRGPVGDRRRVLANALMVALAATVILRPFFGRAAAVPAAAHEAPAGCGSDAAAGVLVWPALVPEMVGTC